MKKYYTFLLVCLLVSTITFAQRQDANISKKKHGETAQIKWEEGKVYDFGKIPRKVPAKHEFVFTNVGDTPIIITHVSSSCGCTVPKYSKNPIQPGKKGSIEAVYNAASMGVFRKTLTLHVNTEAGKEYLTVRGEVVAAE